MTAQAKRSVGNNFGIICDRLSLAAAAALCSLPFLVGTHGDLVPTFYAEWLAFAIGLVLVVQLADRSGAVTVPPIAIGLAAFAGVLALQAALGVVAYPERNALGILYALWAALLAIGGCRLRERFGLERAATVLQVAFAGAGAVLALSGIMQRFELELLGFKIVAPGNEMLGLVGQRNHFANLVSVGLASIVFLAAERRVSLVLAGVVAAPMLFALPLAGSRSILPYALIVLGATTLPALTSTNRSGSRRAARLVAVAGGALVLLVLAHGQAGERIMQSFSAGEPVRAALARYAWEVFLASPLAGGGWNELAWNTLGVAPAIGLGLGSLAAGHAHNLVLQLLAETGIVGALAIVLPLALWFIRFPWRWPLAAECWLLAIAAIQVFHGLVELPQSYAHFLGPFALVLGLGTRFAPELPLAGARRLAPIAAIAAGALALAGSLAEYRAIERWRAETAASAGQASPAALARLIELRGGLFGWRIDGALALAAEPSPAALALTRRAMRGHPQPELAQRYAELLDLAGQPAEAARVRKAQAVLERPAGTKKPD